MQKKKKSKTVTPFAYSQSLETRYDQLAKECAWLKQEKQKDRKTMEEQAQQIAELLAKVKLLEKYEKAKKTTITRSKSVGTAEVIQDMFAPY